MRLVLLLYVDGCAERAGDGAGAVAEIHALIRQFGGQIEPKLSREPIGIWGRERMRADDAERVMAAACAVQQSTVADGEMRCILDAVLIEAAKNGQSDDAIDLQRPPRAAFEMAAEMAADGARDTLVSARFKSVAGLSDSLTPVSFPGATSRLASDPFFVLRDTVAGCDAADKAKHGSCHVNLISTLDGLGDLRPLIVAAAIAGETFAQPMLARMIETEADRLDTAMEAACQIGVLVRRERRDGERRYTFQNADLRMAAYHTVTTSNRLKLHQKAAEALRDLDTKGRRGPMSQRLLAPGADGCDRPSQSPADAMVRHHQGAENSTQSMRWLSKAAWQSIAAGNVADAITHLRAALAQEGPETGRTALKRALLQLLGVQLAVTRGNGSEDVFDAYQRSIDLAHRAVPPAMAAKLQLNWGQEFRSLWLAQSCHLVKGEVRAALTIGQLLIRQMRTNGHQSEAALGQRILVNRMQALSLLLGGDLSGARAHYDTVLDQYLYERHAILRHGYGSDQAALAHAHRAWLCTLAGDSDAAASATQLAMRHCERLQHAHTSAHVMAVLSLSAFSAGAYSEAVIAAREARAVASENGFAYWTAWAEVMLAADDVRRAWRGGQAKLEAAMTAYRATGALQLCPIIYAQLGAAALRDGDAQSAKHHADDGLDMIAWNGCVLYRPELLRVKALAQHAMGDATGFSETLERGFQEAKSSGTLLFARHIAREGLRLDRGQAQILWQVRHHQVSAEGNQ